MVSENPSSAEETEAELRAVFAPRSEYYLRQWREEKRNPVNWAAFFFSGLWLPFRRLYAVALVFYGVIALESLIEDGIFWWLDYPEPPRAVSSVVGLAAAGVCGALGNSWYFRKVRRVIRETRALSLLPDQHLQELARRGGTHLWHALGFFILFMLLLFAAVAFLVLVMGE